MNLIATLVVAASFIVPHPVQVHCVPPPGHVWSGDVWGYSDMRSNIYLRHCDLTVRRRWAAEVIFGHELLHILHPRWPHSRVYPMSYRLQPIVDRALSLAERRR